MTDPDYIRRIGDKVSQLVKSMPTEVFIRRWLDLMNLGGLDAEESLDMLLDELEVDRLLLETDKRASRNKCD